MPEANAPICLAVFDSNILVRIALAKTQAIKRLWDAAQSGIYRLVISPSILTELERVLNYSRIGQKYGLTHTAISSFLGKLRKAAFVTDDLYEVFRVYADPTDNIFLACALEGNVDYLVSEDPHLRDIVEYHGIQIIGLEEFQKIVGL